MRGRVAKWQDEAVLELQLESEQKREPWNWNYRWGRLRSCVRQVAPRMASGLMRLDVKMLHLSWEQQQNPEKG